MFDKALMKLPGMPAVMALLMVSSIVQAMLTIGWVLALAGAISNLWAGKAIAEQMPLVMQFVSCIVARYLVVFVQDLVLDSYSRKQASALKERMLGAIFDERSLISNSVGSASAATSATSGADEIENYIRIMPPKLCGMVGISIPILIAVFLHDWISGVILLVAFPVIIFFMIILGRQARMNAERQYETYHLLSNHFIDTLRGIDVLKAFGVSKQAGQAVYDTSERFREATVKTLRVATLSSVVLDLIATFGVAAVAMMLAFGLMDGTHSLNTALIALMLAPEYFTPIRAFANDYHASLDGKNALAAALAIVETGKTASDVAGKANGIDSESGSESVVAANENAPETMDPQSQNAQEQPAIEAVRPSASPAVLAPYTNRSVFEARNISFAYDGADASALTNVSFKVNGFTTVGIVGESGSGKSTLASILAGFTDPASGQFAIDGIECASLREGSWKQQLNFIPQHPYVFKKSLVDNVRLYSPTASDEQVRVALETVGLAQFSDGLEQGADTMIGEGGRGLSGGQAQRIALARMLLDEKRPVLVFDEPTAHLDIETEYELKERMLPFMNDRLVFFATHRLHWLSSMDFVLVLENGAVAEFGTPAELAANDGALARMLARAKGGEVA